MKTKTITFKLALIALFIITAWISSVNVNGQSSCISAVSFTPTDSYQVTTYQITDSIYWLKFVATSDTIFLQIAPPNNTPQASINHIYLYRGSCRSLVLLSSSGINDSLAITYESLTPGNTYYVKVSRLQTTSAYFGLAYQKVGPGNDQAICPPPLCQLIGNGDFEYVNWPLSYPVCPFSPGHNDVCRWTRAWGSPQLKPFPYSPVNHYAYMWSKIVSGTKQSEAIKYKINIPAGSYTLNFSYQLQSSTLDSLIVCLTTYDSFNPIAPAPSGQQIPYNTWTSNTRHNIIVLTNNTFNSNWTHVTVPFTTNSPYVNLIIYPSDGSGNMGSVIIDSVAVTAQPPDPPVISGQWNTCHTVNGVVTTSDTILNWNPSYTYEYYISGNGAPQSVQGNPFNVDWSGHENGGWLVVKVTNDSTNCYSLDSIKVFDCCVKSGGPVYADTTLSAGPTISNEVFFNGQIIINSNVTLSGATAIEMGPNTKIIIKPGKTLTVANTILKAFCDTMWDGIFISGPTAHLSVQNSYIDDAKNAIVSNDGGDFQLSNNVLLDNNYKNVVVNSYTGATHTGKISKTTIKCDAALLPQYPPVTAARTYSGVQISGVDKIFIGDSTSYANRNTFDNMEYGIYASCSDFYVYNNKFLNIDKVFNTPKIGIAIYAFGARNCGITATVGGQNASGYYRSNYFNSCYEGVHLTSSVGGYLKAQYDTLVMQTYSLTYPTGIYYNASSTSDITIRYNKVSNGKYGINCANFGEGSSMNISSNYIEKASTGIASTNVNLTAPYTFQIAKNYISYPNTYTTTQTGILVTNVDSAAGGATPYAFISQNRVFFTNPSLSYTAYGIRVQNSPHTHIEANCVRNTTNTYATDSNQAKRFNGIQVELSQYAYLCEDTIFRIGCGLRFLGTMSPSRIKVNMMDTTWFGVRFDIASVGQQGIASMGNGNKWRGLQTWRVNGTWSPAIWYYYSLTDLTLFPIASFVKTSPTATPFNIVNATAYLASCSTITPLNLIGPLQSAVTGQTNYPFYEAENKYIEKTQAYLTLKNNPALLNSLAQTNSIYQTFYNTVAASNIGSFAKVNDLMVSGNYNNALILNSSISPSNTMEINSKTVNDIYLNSWANERFELTVDEYNSLYGIAAQDPVLGGFGVYSARVMVGEPETYASGLKTTDANNNTVKPEIIGLIYPDPITDIANIDYDIKSADNIILSIFGLTGNKLMEFNLDSKVQHYSFSTLQLKSGVYFYEITSGNNIISNNKFVIVK